MIKPNWDVFKSKFSENPQWNFEWFCYVLFCREHKKSYGIQRYKNQAGIEIQPIQRKNDIIGMQAKFYDNSTLSNHKNDLIKTLKTIHEKYPNLNKLYLYSNQAWGQGKDGSESQAELEVNTLASSYNIQVEYRLTSYFETAFVAIDNKDISSYFFSTTNTENIFEKVNTLNDEYDRAFRPLKGGIIHRFEEKECLTLVNQGENLIIHGKAGRGKSGITANIIKHFKNENIPYLAIKLDKRVPEHNSDKWSGNLGLPCNIAECIDHISKDTTGVLILDQLDALRWTQSHSRVSLDICCEIINKIKFLNTRRENKISIIFVCRTYDLFNDNSIKSLFETSDEQVLTQWSKIQVNDLSEEDTLNLIGEKYKTLNIKTKSVLRILSNIFIWQEINEIMSVEEINECVSTFKLIEKWWGAVKRNGGLLDFSANDLEQSKSSIVSTFEQSNKLEIAKRRLKIDEKIIDFLVSQNFIVCSGDKVSFAHQSILDYLFAQKMEEDYINGLSVEDIIGDNQNPVRRFQLQLLMQMLLEVDTQEFIDFGENLINSDKIRYSFKFVFYEILNQVDIDDININQFILRNCVNEIIINNVLLNNKYFIRLFIKKGILDKWILDNKKVGYIFIMLYNLSKAYNDSDIDFIEKHIDFLSGESKRFDSIFWRDVSEDSDRLFELRMQVYEKYPERITRIDFDIDQIFIKSQKRAIILLKFLLKNATERNDRELISSERLINKNHHNIIEEPMYVINELIDFVPISSDISLKHWNNWSNHIFPKNNLERSVVELLKLASKNLAEYRPKEFFDIIEDYFGIGSYLHNEIILFALQYVSSKYSDRIIRYILSDFNNNAFDYTSDTDNKLFYTKVIIRNHSKYCCNETFEKLENFIYYYQPSDMIEKARSVFQYRKSDVKAFMWGYHGDLQYEILKELDSDRINKNTADYIKVLNRKFNGTSKYQKINSISTGCVRSPIHNKYLSDNQWVQLLSNNNILEDRSFNWMINDSYSIDNSLSQFGSDFQRCVSNEPNRFIKLYLKHYINIRVEFGIYLLQGISSSDNLEEVLIDKLERVIQICISPYNESVCSSILDVIYKTPLKNWSIRIIDLILEIALRCTKEFKSYEYTPYIEDNVTNIMTRYLNNIKSKAISTLSQILWKHKDFFEKFKIAMLKNINDDDVAIKYAVYDLLRAMYNIDKEYATPYIIKLFTEDVITTGAYDADYLIYWISKENDLKSTILAMYSSQHKQLYEKGTQLIVELYLRDNAFENIINNTHGMEKNRKKIIVKTVIMHFDDAKYNTKCKKILNLYKEDIFDFEISRLFYDDKIDLSRDREFIISLKDVGIYTLKSFKKFLSQKALSVIDYSDIIIQFCEDYILKYNGCRDSENGLSNLLFGLYDETKDNVEYVEITNKCLDLIDLMFENNIGNTRLLSKQIMDR